MEARPRVRDFREETGLLGYLSQRLKRRNFLELIPYIFQTLDQEQVEHIDHRLS